jgi:protein subunit release factor A
VKAACRACPRDEPGTACDHAFDQRHGRRKRVSSDDFGPFDQHLKLSEAEAEDATEPAENRVPTERLPPPSRPLLAARVILEFDANEGGEEAAVFLETCAKLIREKRRVILICE